jgi:hypothetical protein
VFHKVKGGFEFARVETQHGKKLLARLVNANMLLLCVGRGDLGSLFELGEVHVTSHGPHHRYFQGQSSSIASSS